MNNGVKSKPWLAPYIGAGIIFLLFSLTAVVGVAASPTACAVCHGESPAVESWGRSAHSRITCAACHVDRGIQGALGSNFWHFLKAVEPAKKANASSESVISDKDWTTVPVERCRRCHSPENRSFTVTRGLKMNHTAHLKNNIACTVCHNRVAHPARNAAGKAKSRDDKLTMVRGCWRCHSSSGQFRDSQLLSQLPASAKPPTDCSTCHNEKWKLKPSAGDIAHDTRDGIPWAVGTLRHGATAKKLGFTTCFGCHDRQQWCGDKCHSGIAMPHNSSTYANVFVKSGEPNWRKVHFKVAEAVGQAACKQCHDSPWRTERNEDFCMKCHHKAFYEKSPELGTPWVKVAMPYVKENGAGKCWDCHQPEFCVTCHVTGQKPPPGKTFIPTSGIK